MWVGVWVGGLGACVWVRCVWVGGLGVCVSE